VCAGRILSPPTGLHFGCQYVGSGSVPVYDFLPDQMLSLVTNRKDFLGAVVFDKWFSTGDSRQAAFYRDNAPSSSPQVNLRWLAEMIDHESVFHGPEWTFRNSPPQGLYPRLPVYGTDLTAMNFEPWLDRIRALDAAFFQLLLHAIPAHWITDEEDEVSKLLYKLQDRRDRLPELLEEAIVYIHANQGRMPVEGEEGMNRVEPNEECLAG
jgi:hypothetical protein